MSFLGLIGNGNISNPLTGAEWTKVAIDETIW
jgi:hypothetical protein